MPKDSPNDDSANDPLQLGIEDLKRLGDDAQTPVSSGIISQFIAFAELRQSRGDLGPGASYATRRVYQSVVDPRVDCLLTVIRSLGGLNVSRDSKDTRGADWEGRLNTVQPGMFGMPPIERKNGGLTFDELTERLSEMGFISPERDPHELEKLLSNAETGVPVYSNFADYEEIARLDAERNLKDGPLRRMLATIPDYASPAALEEQGFDADAFYEEICDEGIPDDMPYAQGAEFDPEINEAVIYNAGYVHCEDAYDQYMHGELGVDDFDREGYEFFHVESPNDYFTSYDFFERRDFDDPSRRYWTLNTELRNMDMFPEDPDRDQYIEEMLEQGWAENVDFDQVNDLGIPLHEIFEQEEKSSMLTDTRIALREAWAQEFAMGHVRMLGGLDDSNWADDHQLAEGFLALAEEKEERMHPIVDSDYSDVDGPEISDITSTDIPLIIREIIDMGGIDTLQESRLRFVFDFSVLGDFDLRALDQPATGLSLDEIVARLKKSGWDLRDFDIFSSHYSYEGRLEESLSCIASIVSGEADQLPEYD